MEKFKNLLLQNNLENVSLSNESIKIISDLDVNNYIWNSKNKLNFLLYFSIYKLR